MSDARMRRLAELARSMDDEDLASLLDSHKKALALYEYNLEMQNDIVAALEAEAAGREKRGQGRGNL